MRRTRRGLPLSDGYTRAERESIAAAARLAQSLRCPRCDAPLKQSDVPPTPEVAYVRKRALLVCTSCHRSAAIDLPRR